MNLWRLLRSKFIWVNSKDAAQREVTRLVGLGFSLLQGRNYVEARGLLLRALQHESKIENPALLEWILTSLAITWEQTEEYQEGTTFFSDFISRNPNHALALCLRAESLWYDGRAREAIADYDRALELKPNHAPALSGRGQVLTECGQFGRALEDLNSALNSIDAVEGANADWKVQLEAYIRNGRAATYAGLGEFVRASEEFEKSISLCPENAWVYFNRAEAYHKQGDQVNAAENYRVALAKKQPKLTSLKRAHAQRMLNMSTL
jgi:tetratricopeptide (TPR) repeat protein